MVLRSRDFKNRLIVTGNKAIRLNGSEATVWDDLRVPVLSTKTGGSKDPDWVKFKDDGAGSQGVFTYAFSPTAEEEVYFAVQMPHNWKQETDLHPHIHWAKSNANVGNVTWGLEYTKQEIHATFGNTTIITGTTPLAGDAGQGDHKHSLTELGIIDMTGFDSVSSMLVCRVFRDATNVLDTYTSDAFLLEIDFHYEIDSLGSETEYVKL